MGLNSDKTGFKEGSGTNKIPPLSADSNIKMFKKPVNVSLTGFFVFEG
ncbi:hypothetical protein ATK78_0002 [Pedobacter metabolipauper]|uniref:Uncharacterized protein n=1 Tax=Pedobacter metabolipauper TaxID=425513 RepID=A0A4V3D1R5_9SPHI|nr:hypothetical protein ATK78_0002 [Pedobacter metabolipauper]